MEPLKSYWCVSTLKLFSPTQLTANHRMDHLCWDQLWPMRETKLTGVKVASSCLSSSVITVSLHQASGLFVRRVGCSFQEFHTFTSSKIPSIISFHTIFQSWHHQQLQSIYFPLILSSLRLFDECENITTIGFWGLISLLRSYWPAPVAPLGHSAFIVRQFFLFFCFQKCNQSS